MQLTNVTILLVISHLFIHNFTYINNLSTCAARYGKALCYRSGGLTFEPKLIQDIHVILCWLIRPKSTFVKIMLLLTYNLCDKYNVHGNNIFL